MTNTKQDREIEFQRKCSDFVHQHVHLCQSMLVDELLKHEFESEFTLDNITNYYPEKPEGDADLADIKAFFDGHSISDPDDSVNPWAMPREKMVELLTAAGEDPADMSEDQIRQHVIELMDSGAIDGKDEWLRELRHADIDPPEIYEWWVVSDFLERKLKDTGHPFLENDYGSWWGRCTTGQSISIDDSIRQIVRTDIIRDLESKLQYSGPLEASVVAAIEEEINVWKNHH